MYKLPFNIDLNTIDILKQLSIANNNIGELKGVLNLLPNPGLVLSLVLISESKDSSAIENIITTYDQIFKEMVSKYPSGGKPKEVVNYKNATEHGLKLIKEKKLLNTNIIIEIQERIEQNKGGIRRLPGTVIMNDVTKETVHTPPQNEIEIRNYLKNLEEYINLDSDYDPLINMALIHFQFESIHPFYDGNGRTGRILNVLYLVLKEKIQEPILYLSKYIIENKDEYYSLLKKCNEDINYISDFVMYILRGVTETSKTTIELIMSISNSIDIMKEEMKSRLPEIYMFEIVQHLFSFLYTKNEYFKEDLNISRATATKYLKLLEKEGFIVSERLGKEVIYKNVQLFMLLKE